MRLKVEAGDRALLAGCQVLLEFLDVVDHDGDGGQESLGDATTGLTSLPGVQGGVDGLQPPVATFDVSPQRLVGRLAGCAVSAGTCGR